MTTPFALKLAGASLAIAALSPTGSALAADPPAPAVPPASPPLAVAERVWPGHPEWVAMLVDILGGSRLGPTDGWFRQGHSRSRLDWAATQSRLDKDDDGRVIRDEFPGDDADFARLDRDRDRAITANDFDFSPTALASSPGGSFFARTDRDGDGKLTKAELDAFFARADSDGQGFVSLDDAKAALNPPQPAPPRRRRRRPPGARARPGGRC